VLCRLGASRLADLLLSRLMLARHLLLDDLQRNSDLRPGDEEPVALPIVTDRIHPPLRDRAKRRPTCIGQPPSRQRPRARIAAQEESSSEQSKGLRSTERLRDPDKDALNVRVRVNILDEGGQILRSESDSYQAIPAGVTYYAGGDAIFSGTPARLVVTVQTESSQKKAGILLPPVSNVRVTEDFLGTSVVGEVMNPYPPSLSYTNSSRSLSHWARLTVVCFDGAGNVIGGAEGVRPDAGNLPAGERMGFDISLKGLSASQVASVQVSVEPRYTRPGPGGHVPGPG
jgi:hypothetical protein